jgi:hypothetical protein
LKLDGDFPLHTINTHKENQMHYPNDEDGQIDLARRVAAGLAEQTDIFPTPPIAPDFLKSLIDDFQTKRQIAEDLRQKAQQAFQACNDALQALNSAVKSDLSYAEKTVNFNQNQLQLIGWGGGSASNKHKPPGQCSDLETVKLGNGWIYFDWTEPVNGGKITGYKIMRSSDDGATWETVATSIESEYTLHNQPMLKNLLYRVVAINKAGEGAPSNTVSISF